MTTSHSPVAPWIRYVDVVSMPIAMPSIATNFKHAAQEKHKRKAPDGPAARRSNSASAVYHSRLPMNCSRKVNMLMKSRYRLSAPIITVFPIMRSEEHTSELQSLMRSSYDVFC